MLPGVLHDGAEARFADHLLRRTENPDSRMVHFDHYIDALARAEKDGIEFSRRRYRISVERDHLHLVAGQRDAAIFNGAGVEEMNQQALAFADADRIAGAERLVVDGVGHRTDFEAVGVGVQRGRLFEQRSIVGIVVFVIHGRR